MEDLKQNTVERKFIDYDGDKSSLFPFFFLYFFFFVFFYFSLLK